MTRPEHTPFVSVIVPTYNEKGFVGPCIEGFQNQSYPPDRFEILVVDGMSADGSRDEVLALAALDPRVRLIDNPRRVAAAAANEGIRHAQGDVLCFLSAHGVPHTDYVASSVRVLLETGAGGVGGKYLHVGLDRVSRAIGLAMSSPFGMASPHRVSSAQREADTISHPTFIRQVFDAVGGYDETLSRNEDYELNYRVRQAGFRLVFSPEISSVYRPRSSLKALARQFYAYGHGKAEVMRRHPRSVQARHLVPPVAALGAALTPVLVLAPPTRRLVAAGAGVYALLVSLAIGRERPSCHEASTAVFALALPVMHATWGAGVVIGLLRSCRNSRPVQ